MIYSICSRFDWIWESLILNYILKDRSTNLISYIITRKKLLCCIILLFFSWSLLLSSTVINHLLWLGWISINCIRSLLIMSYLAHDSLILSFSYYEFILFRWSWWLLVINITIVIVIVIVAVYAIINNVISAWNTCTAYKRTIFVVFILYLW